MSCLAAAAVLLWLDAAQLYFQTRPIFGTATLIVPSAAPRSFAYPFVWRKAPRTRFVLVQRIQLSRLHPTTFQFYPRDFLWAIRANGRDVRADSLPLSGASLEGRSIDLAPFLHPGMNEITLDMQVRFGEASFLMCVSPWDRCSGGLLALISCATVATAAWLSALSRISILKPEILVLLAGAGLRYIYLLGTPFFVRSFDYWGHADYLDYVIQRGVLPPPGANWEAFQPPLYYLIVGGITKLLLAVGLPEGMRFAVWQGISALDSMGILIVGYRIAHILYENEPARRFYMLAVLAVAPPLVFNAARVSNDDLLALLAFVWLSLLIQFWRRPAASTWMWLSAATGLALLTKANALSLLIISPACLVLNRLLTPRAKILHIATFIAITSALAGSYYVPRALHATALNTYVVGNLASLNYHGHIESVLPKSLIFNPFKVIRYPFDEAWGPRHDYFPEVFFKTMLLGDWIKGFPYKFMARIMVMVALLLIAPLVLGIYRAARSRTAFDQPLLLVLGGIFLAQWLFLQAAPYLSTQDFRYSIVLIVPLIHFVLYGIYKGNSNWKSAMILLLQCAILNSAIYVTLLALA